MLETPAARKKVDQAVQLKGLSDIVEVVIGFLCFSSELGPFQLLIKLDPLSELSV